MGSPIPMPKVVLVNDCSKHGHFGCLLIMEAYREQLARVGMELIGVTQVDDDLGQFEEVLAKPAFKMLDKADLVIVNGEGTTHRNRHQNLIKIAGRFPSVLINMVYQDNRPLPEMHQFLYRSARESLSAAVVRQEGVQCDVVPDIIFTSKTLTTYRSSRKATNTVGITDTVLDNSLGFPPTMPPNEYLGRLSRHRAVVCGRFHGAVACAVLGIPFSVYPSNTHKNLGLVTDIGIPHLHGQSQAEAIALCPDELPEQVTRYVAEAQSRVNTLFENLVALCK